MTVSLLPQLAGGFLPPASPVRGLTDDERQLVTGLSTKLAFLTPWMLTSQSYYDGEQRLANLGVSIPPSLAGVRTVVDWPRICVDPLVQRAVIDGFRLPGQTETDSELWAYWQANNMDAEFPLCILDSLTLGRGYCIVGSPDTPGDAPIITVESPFNMALNWDPRTRKVTAAYQSFEVEGVFRAVLYLPNVTVFMSREQASQWAVDERDEHNLGEVPVVRFSNRQRTADREGRSEITPAVRNTTDSAIRTLLGMEIAREFYSVPHRYILGATESDFQAADGTPKTAIDMVMSKFLAFERNDRGDLPQVGQFQAFDPSVFTKIIDKHAMLMSSYTNFPPDYFGMHSQSNPASADAIRSAQDGLNRRGRQVQNQASDPAEQVMRLVWRFAHDGEPVPDALKQLETDWTSVATPTPAATADAIYKQVGMGAIPPTSDVTLAELGWSQVQRARLAQDRANDVSRQLVAEVASSLEAKQIRTDKSITDDLAAAAEPPKPEPTAPDRIVVAAHERKRPGKSPGN
ncbi:MAG: phage portal protein [Frankiales bacterium]|nr:phage portal protein [Frankiales bacterium]